MDSFFKAAVCDLDKLLDDFEQNTEELDCKSTRSTPTTSIYPGPSLYPSPSLDPQCFVPEPSAVHEALPDVNNLHYSSSAKYSDSAPSYSLYQRDYEVKGRPLTGVDLLSSVDSRAAKSTAPPCPDRALKPVCDLVSDTGSAILLRANSHDAFKELDIVEKQLEEELLVDFDSPVVSLPGEVLQAGHGRTIGSDSLAGVELLEQESCDHLEVGGHLASLSLLDIILPAVADSPCEPQGTASLSSSETLESLAKEDKEVLQNEEYPANTQNSKGYAKLPCVMDSEVVVSTVSDISGDDVEKDTENQMSDGTVATETGEWNANELEQDPERQPDTTDTQALSSSLQDDTTLAFSPSEETESSLSCLPIAVSMCGSLVSSLDSVERMASGVEEEAEVESSASEVVEASSGPVDQQNIPSLDEAVNHVDDVSLDAASDNDTARSEMRPFSDGIMTQACSETSEACSCPEEDLDLGSLAEGTQSPSTCASPGTPPEFAFVDDFIPDSEQGVMLVTDEELDAFLMEQSKRDYIGGTSEKSTDEGFSELNGDLEGHSVPFQDGLTDGDFENSVRGKADGLASPESEGMPPSVEESDNSNVSTPSQDNSPCWADLVNTAGREVSHSTAVGQSTFNTNQHPCFGGARPKQLCGQAPRTVPTFESEDHEKSDMKDVPHAGDILVNNIHSPPASAVGEVPNRCVTGTGYPYPEGHENSIGYSEMSEPPPYPEDTGRERASSLDDQLAREADSLGSRQPPWVPDSEAPNCMNCLQKFTFTKRRHHCRACGKVYCAVCCNRKCRLKYLDKEARVCVVCHETIQKAQALERMMSPTGPSPNPNIPSEYCSTIPPMQQARAAGTLNSPPPTVMVPVSVLKHPGNDGGFPREQKRVWFADGILPNGEVADTTKLSVGGRRTSQESSPITPDPQW